MYQFPKQRPRFLKLSEIHFCHNAINSALHSISGSLVIAGLVVYLVLATTLFLEISALSSLQDNLFLKWFNTFFWIALYFHWLSGLKHLVAEHFLKPNQYQKLNSETSSKLLFHAWWLGSVVIIWNFLL